MNINVLHCAFLIKECVDVCVCYWSLHTPIQHAGRGFLSLTCQYEYKPLSYEGGASLSCKRFLWQQLSISLYPTSGGEREERRERRAIAGQAGGRIPLQFEVMHRLRRRTISMKRAGSPPLMQQAAQLVQLWRTRPSQRSTSLPQILAKTAALMLL